MEYRVVFAPEAIEDLRLLSARDRTTIRNVLQTHLRYEPEKVSRSRIKRLEGLRRPQYRLRVGEFRIYYDVETEQVRILAIVPKSGAATWLEEMGEPE